MNNKKKIFLISMLLVSGLFFFFNLARAEDFIPGVTIPNSEFKAGEKITVEGDTLAKYISAVYSYSVGIVAILATVIMMYAGFLWVTSAGNSERVGNAKSWISAALSGLVLVLASYMILNTVNPDLVNLKKITPRGVENIPMAKPVLGAVCGDKHCELGEVCQDNKCVDQFEVKGCCEVLWENNSWVKESVCQLGMTHVNCVKDKAGREANPRYRNFSMNFYSDSTDYSCVSDRCASASNPCLGKTGITMQKKNTLGEMKNGYCLGGDWFPCKATGVYCGAMSADYECCNGDCEDAPGTFTGNICN